jgi:hypothetical protein
LDTSNLKITIFNLSYRDKRIIETIDDAFNKCSDISNIRSSIIIQDSYHHKIQKFSATDEIKYLLWDQFEGFSRHRAAGIQSIPEDNYILFVSSATEFQPHWDRKLKEWLSEHNVNEVLSKKEDAFSLDGTFINKKIFSDIGYPNYLRMMGEEEDISIKLYAKSYKVYSGIDKIIINKESKEQDYIPFSVTHNYDQVQKLYDFGFNNFVDLKPYSDRAKFYANKNPIKKIYHQLNEVEYRDQDIRKLDENRFLHHGSRV